MRDLCIYAPNHFTGNINLYKCLNEISYKYISKYLLLSLFSLPMVQVTGHSIGIYAASGLPATYSVALLRSCICVSYLSVGIWGYETR